MAKTKVTISAIYAVAENGVIGRHNAMPWYLPADFQYFKRTTIGHPIIMGRKTYDSIGRPLPRRTNIIISRNENLKINGCIVVHSLEEAVAFAKKEKPSQIFIAGGATIYQLALPILDKVYRTVVHISPIGDAHFFLPDNWKVVSSEFHFADRKNLVPYSFEVLER